MTNEIYVSTDVETDGPIPGVNSLLSIGSAAYLPNKTLVSTFSANLELLPGALADPVTTAWWKTQPEAWKKARNNLEMPEIVFKRYLKWLKDLPEKPIFVGYPVSFDFLFVYWYLIRFTGESPFGYSALDIRSYAMAVLKSSYSHCKKQDMPKHWFDPMPHSHVAIDDAISQGRLFCNILQENIAKK